MNSRTSRPRSPTRQITLTDAVVERAIMPSSVDLPTPEPAKMPSRWPRPHGTSASSARTPRSSRSSMRVRCSGDGGRPATARSDRRSSAGPPSIGRPRPSSTRPRSASPTRTRNGSPVGSTRRAGADAVHLAERHQQRAARRGSRPPRPGPAGGCGRPRSCTSSPTSARRPVASITSPIRLVTRPRVRCRVGLGHGRAVPRERRRRRQPVVAASTRAERRPAADLGRSSAQRSSCEPMRASISPSSVRTMQPPRSTRRSATTSSRRTPPSRAASPLGARGTSSRVVRVHLDHEPVVAVGGAQERASRRPRARARARLETAAPTIFSAIASASSTAERSAAREEVAPRAPGSAARASATASSAGATSARASARPSASPSSCARRARLGCDRRAGAPRPCRAR